MSLLFPCLSLRPVDYKVTKVAILALLCFNACDLPPLLLSSIWVKFGCKFGGRCGHHRRTTSKMRFFTKLNSSGFSPPLHSCSCHLRRTWYACASYGRSNTALNFLVTWTWRREDQGRGEGACTVVYRRVLMRLMTQEGNASAAVPCSSCVCWTGVDDDYAKKDFCS